MYDGLGSTTDLTDGTGNVIDGYGYDVFGTLRSGSPGANSFLFTGEQRDAGLGSPAMGLYYLRARYYDPAIGRFLGRDPVPGGNLYAYVGNNPVNRVDPRGLDSERGGLQERLFEELLFQDCAKFVLVAVALALLAIGFLALPAFAGVSGVAAVALAGISSVNFLATAGASAGIGYAAYEICTVRDTR